MSVKKFKRIDNLLLIKFAKLYKKKDIFSIANLELLKGIGEEMVLEKAYYKNFYKCFNVIFRLRSFNNIARLKDFSESKTLLFYSSVFSFEYYSLFRNRKGESVIRSYVKSSKINAAVFHFSKALSLSMFLNIQGISAKLMLKRMDDHDSQVSSEIIHERLDKKLYVQTIPHIIPQYFLLFDRKFESNEIRTIFEYLQKIAAYGVLGFNTVFINTCFIFVFYYVLFLITVFSQIICTVDYLVNQLVNFKR